MTAREDRIFITTILTVFILFTACRHVTSSSGKNETISADKSVVYIGGFFPFPGNPFLAAQQKVAQAALDHVNDLAGILDGYQLKMRWNWTGAADPEEALRVLYTFLYTGPPIIMTWGPFLAREAIVVNQVAARYNIVQIGVASNDALSDRSVYPYTVRAYPTGQARYAAMAAFFKQMAWKRISFIYRENASFRQTNAEFQKVLEAEDIHVVASEGVKDITEMDIHLQNLKRQDARIIYIGFNKNEALKLYCQAYLAGMYGAKYVWIAPPWATTVWWLNPSPSVSDHCTEDQIIAAVQSSLHFITNQRQQDLLDLDYNGVKPLPEHYDYFNRMQPVSNIAYTYDGIIAIALSLNASTPSLQRLEPPRRLEEFSYSDQKMAEVILKHADSIHFTGLSGRVLIEDGQRKIEMVYIDRAQDRSLEPVMVYRVQTRHLVTSGDLKDKWQGGYIPVDGTTRRPVTQQISSPVRVALYSLSSVGVIMALAFLCLNVKYKHRRAIKMSSPPLSNLTAVGCLLLYASVFVTGLDTFSLSDTAIIFKCHIEKMLISLGLSLAFGSMFMRTYRMRSIFLFAVKQFKQIDLPDWKLIGGVWVIVFVDCVIFTLWITLDLTAVYSKSSNPQINMTEPNKEIYDVRVIRYCGSAHAQYFVMAIYGVKGILLIFGLFLAWETRNIAVSHLNDSKYIAASVYIVSLAITMTVPTMMTQNDDVNMTFAIPGVAIIIVNTSVLCLNFIPKVYLLITVDEKDMHVSLMQSFGFGKSTDPNTSRSTVKDSTSKLDQQYSKLAQKKLELKRLCLDLQRIRSATTKPSKRPNKGKIDTAS